MNNSENNSSGVLSQPEFTSATALSTAANYIMNAPEAFIHTYRTYIRLRENGRLTLKFWYSNAVDSTWDLGADAVASEPGASGASKRHMSPMAAPHRMAALCRAHRCRLPSAANGRGVWSRASSSGATRRFWSCRRAICWPSPGP